jgi:ethylbenzene dioxygenase beta subunit
METKQATESLSADRGKAISPGDARYFEVLEFLYQEAELLDGRRFAEWLELLTEDVSYRMPQPVNRGKTPGYSDVTEIMSENLASLRVRVRKMGTEFAWADDPPSRTRHLVTNIRARETARPEELAVSSSVLVYRHRSQGANADLFCGERQDVLRKVDGEWRLARRSIFLDRNVVEARHLAIFF